MERELVSHGQYVLRYVVALGSQFSEFIPRPEYTGMLQTVRDEIKDVRSGLAEKFVMLVEKLTGLERRIETLESSGGGDARLRNEVSEMKGKIRDVTAECSSWHEKIMSLQRQFKDKMSIIPPPQCKEDVDKNMPWRQTVSYNGELLWKIEGYLRQRQDAIKGEKTALYSPAFYTAQFGYKMCAKIYMNGDGSGKGSHLSLFFVVMRGELKTYVFGDLGLSPTQRRVCK